MRSLFPSSLLPPPPLSLIPWPKTSSSSSHARWRCLLSSQRRLSSSAPPGCHTACPSVVSVPQHKDFLIWRFSKSRILPRGRKVSPLGFVPLNSTDQTSNDEPLLFYLPPVTVCLALHVTLFLGFKAIFSPLHVPHAFLFIARNLVGWLKRLTGMPVRVYF